MNNTISITKKTSKKILCTVMAVLTLLATAMVGMGTVSAAEVTGKTMYVGATHQYQDTFDKVGVYVWNSKTGASERAFDNCDINTVEGNKNAYFYTFSSNTYDKVIVKCSHNGRVYQTPDMDISELENGKNVFVIEGYNDTQSINGNGVLMGSWRIV